MNTSIVEKVPHGTRIPRLQELSFLEVAMSGVADGAGFEEIRRRLIDHMVALREESDASGNTARFRIAKDTPHRYVSNVSQALKELMLLGLIEPDTVPSSARAAQNYATTTFSASEKGMAWVGLLREDWQGAYDQLLDLLWHAHPQFKTFLKALDGHGVEVPLLQWAEVPAPATRDYYRDFLPVWVARHLDMGQSGWTASESEVREAVEGYLKARYEDARARGREEPYPKNRDLTHACEEALVRFAFARNGVVLDYVSQEILRRWTKDLGIANFSYHVPGVNALRLWPTAVVHASGGKVSATRRNGPELVQRAIELLPSIYGDLRRREGTRSLWVPIHQVRAGVCWNLGIPDGVFERALLQILSGECEDSAPFRVNLDAAQYGTVPPSEAPFRLQTGRGLRTFFAMSLIPKRTP